jgi:hypothetical protein
VAHQYNPRTQEAVGGGSQTTGNTGLHSEILHQKTKQKSHITGKNDGKVFLQIYVLRKYKVLVNNGWLSGFEHQLYQLQAVSS